MERDILQQVTEKDLIKLRDLYEQHQPYATHVHGFFCNALKWTKLRPEKSFITVYVPEGKYEDGTFVAVLQWSCYDLFVFTLEKSCDRLTRALAESEVINWCGRVLFYALHTDHRDAVVKALNTKKLTVTSETCTDLYWLPKEDAIKFEIDCPSGFYIAPLHTEHVSVIDNLWPFRYKGSKKYLRTFIEMNGGHGIFEYGSGRLVAWSLINQLWILAILQTDEEYKRKGLAAAIVKSLSREIALQGHNPGGTIVINNTASQKLFENLGFRVLTRCSFLFTGKE